MIVAELLKMKSQQMYRVESFWGKEKNTAFKKLLVVLHQSPSVN